MNSRELLLTTVETNEAIVGIRRDGIIHIYFKSGTVIDIKLQNQLLQIYNDLTKGKKSLFIFQGGPNCRLTKEARLNALKLDAIAPMAASVVCTINWYQKIIAEFYYILNKPNQKYLVTRDFEKGIRWLQQVHADTQMTA
jgi:hypothetical protein